MFISYFAAAVAVSCLSTSTTASVLQPHEARAASGVCSNGIYRELSVLAQYPPAVKFCSQKFPVKCGAGKNRRQVAFKRSADSPSNLDDTKSAVYSKCLKQPASIISTVCSCIQTPKPCPTSKISTTSLRPPPSSTTASSATPTATACTLNQTNFCRSQTQNACLCKLDADGVTPICVTAGTCPQSNFPNPLAPCRSDADCALYNPGSIYNRCVYDNGEFNCTPTFCATEDGCFQSRS